MSKSGTMSAVFAAGRRDCGGVTVQSVDDLSWSLARRSKSDCGGRDDFRSADCDRHVQLHGAGGRCGASVCYEGFEYSGELRMRNEGVQNFGREGAAA